MQLIKNNTAVLLPTIKQSNAAKGTAAANAAGTSRASVQNSITKIVESAVNMV